MTGWEPTTDAEVALRDALRAGDQETYFRILSRLELVLPVAADAPAGRMPQGWGTWTADDRTHLLSFTSTASMKACLAEHAGSTRRVPFQELAAAWPNQDWWLAVNPGLPIEGYLPAWFVAQMVHGDVRLPGPPAARGRLERLEALERAKARASVPVHNVPPHHVPQRHVPQEPLGDQPMIVDAEVIMEEEFESELLVPTSPALQARLAPPSQRALPEHEAAPVRQAEREAIWESLPAALPPAPVHLEPVRPAPAQTPVHTPVHVVPGQAQPVPTAPSEASPNRQAAEPAAAPVSPPSIPVQQAAPVPLGVVAPMVPAPAAEPPTLMAPPTVADLLGDQPEFMPANSVEARLLEAADVNDINAFTSTLLLATVLLPVPEGSNGARPGDEGFNWQPTEIKGRPHVVCYTSVQRMSEPMHAVPVRFIRLISAWPDQSWSFSVNPGSPVGASLDGGELLALASWAAEAGLDGDDRSEPVMPGPVAGGLPPPVRPAAETTVMQKAVAPSQVGYYLDRGYDRVSGFVHRAREVGHLRSPEQLRRALGLHWEGSPFTAGATEIYVLRWSAYRPSLYRIPYGGPHAAAMRAMEGWVIERAPFRGNGFAPGDSNEIIAEFKVDSARLPHGARLLRVDAEGNEEIIAVLDADGPRWLRTGGGS